MANITIARGPWVINTTNLTGSPVRVGTQNLWVVTTSLGSYLLTASECFQLGYTAVQLSAASTPQLQGVDAAGATVEIVIAPFTDNDATALGEGSLVIDPTAGAGKLGVVIAGHIQTVTT